MDTAAPTSRELLVACMCADWCYICRDYRAVFESLRGEFGAQAQWIWVDIEDDDETLGGVDIDDFPTFLIARGDLVVHFGPLLPRREAACRTVQRALQGELRTLGDARLESLAERLRLLDDAKAGMRAYDP